MYGSRLVGPMLVLMGAAVLTTQPVAADILAEPHVFNLTFNDPEPGSTFYSTFDVPFFDVQGGTRALIGMQVDYFLKSNYTVSVRENPTADWHGCDVRWTHTWTATRDGAQWFPLNQSSNQLSVSTGTGYVLGPYHAAVPASTPANPGGISGREAHDEPALLAALTGTGTFSVDYVHTLSALSRVRPPDRAWGAAPPNQRVFDPNMVDINLDYIGIDLTVTYYYNAVPEPGALALLSLGGLALLRRR